MVLLIALFFLVPKEDSLGEALDLPFSNKNFMLETFPIIKWCHTKVVWELLQHLNYGHFIPSLYEQTLLS